MGRGGTINRALLNEAMMVMAPTDAVLRRASEAIDQCGVSCVNTSHDGTLVFGEVSEELPTPGPFGYHPSVTYKPMFVMTPDSHRPLCWCSCEANRHPCAHVVAMAISFCSVPSRVVVEDPPAEVVERRAKLERQIGKEATGAAGAASAGNAHKKRASSTKPADEGAEWGQVEAKVDALDRLEKVMLDIMGGGVVSVSPEVLALIGAEAVHLGEVGLPGIGGLLRWVRSLCVAKLHETSLSAEARQSRLLQEFVTLWAVLQKGRAALVAARDGAPRGADDDEIEAVLGRTWAWGELDARGHPASGKVLLELAHLSWDDELVEVETACGYLLDLVDGDVFVETSTISHAVRVRGQGPRLRVSRAGVIEVQRGVIYPWAHMNRRVAWQESDPKALLVRPRTPDDYRRVHELARPITSTLGPFREQFGDLLAPRSAVVLLKVARVGVIGGTPVIEDEAGVRLPIGDPPMLGERTTALFRRAAGAWGPGSYVVRLWVDPTTSSVRGQALALVVGDKHIRLS